MTEEEIQSLKEAKEAAEAAQAAAQAAAEAAKAEAEKAKSDLTGVVDELKEERRKKQEALERQQNINNPNPNPESSGEPDVNQLVEQALAKKERERAENEVKSAIEEFKNSKTEFQSDTTGMVFEKFKKDLSRFNFSDIQSKEEAKKRLNEAYDFLRRQENSGGESTYEGTDNPPSTPSSEDKSLPADAKSMGLDPERYNKLSSKYGDALAGLGFGR